MRADRVSAIKGQGDRDQGDAHRMLVRLKVAALLGLLDGRVGIDPDDWRLAELIVDTSRRVRLHVEQILSLTARQVERSYADKLARRELVIDGTRERHALTSAARTIGSLCHRHHEREEHADQGGGCPSSCLRRGLRGGDKGNRHLFDEAIAEAERLDWIVPVRGRWQPGQARPA